MRNLQLAAEANAKRWTFAVWRCAACGKEALATAHQMRKTYCSKECMSAAYQSRMAGASNPNHRDAGKRVCAKCASEYHSYNKDRKFCGHACYMASKPPAAPKVQRQLRLVKPAPQKTRRPPRAQKACIQCAALFSYSPSQSRRLFCSYQCHIDSGGALRAGLAASKATMKYGPKKDANHDEIFDELRQHCAVYDLSKAGGGLPDGVAWICGAWHLFDVKNPKTGYGRRGLNPVQKKWLAQWKGGPVYLIYSVAEASRFGQGDFAGIKAMTPAEALAAIGVTA